MITFENGTKASEASVTISGVKYNVTPAQYTGKTPFNATNLNANFEELNTKINTNATGISELQTTLSNIIESGSNSNGTYIKWSDGTMICCKHIDYGKKAITKSWGSFYESDKLSMGDYPQEFIEIPRIFVMDLNYSFIEIEGNSRSKTSWGNFYSTRPVSVTQKVEIDCFAIGKWK